MKLVKVKVVFKDLKEGDVLYCTNSIGKYFHKGRQYRVESNPLKSTPLSTVTIMSEKGKVGYNEYCIENNFKLLKVESNFNNSKESKDMVNHPDHYNKHPSGIECITIIRHYCFDIGSAIKYLWRAGLKKEEGMTDKQKEIEDLKKAIFYINDRIKTLEDGNKS